MKMTGIVLSCFTAALLTVSCNEATTTEQPATDTIQPKTANEEQGLFPKGAKGPVDNFTGTAYVKLLVSKDSVQNNYAVAEVAFEAGARSNWHDHPAGQIIMVTAGEGYVQEKGQPAQLIKKGDVVVCQPNVDHWHGAAPNLPMTHITLTNYKGDVNVNWKQPVTNEEYSAVANK